MRSRARTTWPIHTPSQPTCEAALARCYRASACKRPRPRRRTQRRCSRWSFPSATRRPTSGRLIEEISQALAGSTIRSSMSTTAAATPPPRSCAPCRAKLATLAVRRHRASCGQSAAIITGIRAAAGEWIATLDGDGQNDPADIPRLLAQHRPITARRRCCSPGTAPAVATAASSALLRRRQPGARHLAARRDARHRLRPETVPPGGVSRAAAVRPHAPFPARPVHPRRRPGDVGPGQPSPRLRGRSNYGTFDRLLVGIVDLAGVAWLQRRWKRPQVEPL